MALGEIVIWIISIIIGLLILVGVFALAHNTDPVERTPEEIAGILESWINDEVDWKEWDYFESCDIKHPELNKIKNECMKIDMPNSPYISNPEEKHLNPAGKKLVSELLAQCKSLY